MAYAPDRPRDPPAYDAPPTTYPPPAPPTPYAAPRYEPPPHGPERPFGQDFREGVTREVTAGPYRFGLREGVLGTLGIFAILGVVLGVLGFAAAFALDNAAIELNDADGANTADDVAASAALLPAILVSLLPFMAAPVLAIGCGAWAGHASRDGTLGAVAGGIGGLLGPILTLLLTGVGFALGAGAANLDLSQVGNIPGFGLAPGWGNTIPYLFTGAGLLWLMANTIGGALTGGLLGSILDRHGAARETRRERDARRTLRY